MLSTFSLVGSSTASMRRITHMERITSGYLLLLKRSRRASSAMPQMKETMLCALPGPLLDSRRAYLTRSHADTIRWLVIASE